ncbi:hypothetical protein [Microbacterium phyllosphaerae]|uniref:hypothetical protein n=1 Tax=Microbacterium phyllosphaerae TaxID=124798 RepID=UPI000EA2781D|nr:hypothetical protein [Microbacterium phyllosphaerae]
MTATTDTLLAALPAYATHHDAERLLRDEGWEPCGAGDWAIALQSPDGLRVARISPFDPVGPYTAALYRQAAQTRLAPELFAHRRLEGGGDLMIMERLHPADEQDASRFLRTIESGESAVSDLVDVVRRVHARALAELPWCGPLDENPANVMSRDDGTLVLIDPYFADGPALYAAAGSDPDSVAARIPMDQRRYMTEIPLAYSGPWPEESREEMRRGLAAADARRAG